jgi:hypothetical protein
MFLQQNYLQLILSRILLIICAFENVALLASSPTNSMVDNKFQPVQTTQPSVTYLRETKRVLKQHIINHSIQCPSATKPNNAVVKFEELFWINENNDNVKPDSNVLISSANLIDKAQLTIRVNNELNFVSCGYLFNSNYVRIKMWNFVYVGN